ncbi:MAG: adenylate/guanylate cyclase domain-containing protein [Burkholderiaceae bacterium]
MEKVAETLCRQCGHPNPAVHRFCGLCGNKLGAASGLVRAETGERRQLTVVFIDLVGSVSISQRLDPEELAVLLGHYHALSEKAVRQFGGHVAQFLGDGVLAYFGYPIALEDAPLRAATAALQIVQDAAAIEVPGHKESLAARAGIHTGSVVMSRVGDIGTHGPLAMGDVPNVAARIQAAAQPGQVLVSDATWTLARDRIIGTAVPKATLKGVAGAHKLWQVSALARSSNRLSGAASSRPFVGRSAELARILAERGRDESDCPLVAVIVGEPGIGKSRLVAQAVSQLAPSVANVFLGQAFPLFKSVPWFPVSRAIGRIAGVVETDAASISSEKIAALIRRLGIGDDRQRTLLQQALSEEEPNSLEDPQALDELGSAAFRRVQTLHALVECIAAIAEGFDCPIVFEDLHWADASTLELIQWLVVSKRCRELKIILSARPELQALASLPASVRRIDLQAFTVAQQETLLRNVFGGKAVPTRLSRAILKQADGVPLFIEEYGQAIIDSGGLVQHESAWELIDDTADLTVPRSIEASLMMRLDKLGSALGTAQVASVVGREFSFQLIDEVAGSEQSSVAQDLAVLEGADLVRRVRLANQQVGYAFKHALIRDAAYASLTRQTRIQIHERVVDVLLSSSKSKGPVRPELVAEHLGGANRFFEAADYWQLACSRAVAASSLDEAASCLEAALEAVECAPESIERSRRIADICDALTPLFMTINGWGSASVARIGERARRMREFSTNPIAHWAAMRALWTHYLCAKPLPEAGAFLDEVAQLNAEAGGIPGAQAIVDISRAYLALYQAEFETCAAIAAQPNVIVDFDTDKQSARLNQISTPSTLFAVSGTQALMTGDIDRAEALWHRSIEHARALELPASMASAIGFVLIGKLDIDCHLGRCDEVESLATELLGLAERETFDAWLPVAQAMLGIVRARRGDASGIPLILEGLEIKRQTGTLHNGVTFLAVAAEAVLEVGADDLASEFIASGLAVSDLLQERLMFPELHRVQALIHHRSNRMDDAIASALAATRASHKQGARMLEARCLATFAQISKGTDSAREALGELCSMQELAMKSCRSELLSDLPGCAWHRAL